MTLIKQKNQLIIQSMISKKNGKILDGYYENYNSIFILECKYGHSWTTLAKYILKNHWCHICNKKNKLTINEMKELAIHRGGLCLSNKYINARTNLQWKCKNNHIWEACPYSIKKGSWCPECHTYISEEICRKYMEFIFNKKFVKIRPQWLLSNSNRPMELDGFNEELGIAFEHQGPHHYQPYNYGGNNSEKYEKILHHDKMKYDILTKKNIKLIVIPTLFSKISLDKLYLYILNECKLKNIVVNSVSDPKIDIKSIYNESILSKYVDIAKQNGGQCVIETYVNVNHKCKWICINNHIWETTPNSIGNGSWCPICSSKKLNIDIANQIAKEKNGRCLSSEYINKRNNLIWQCNVCNNIWEANLGNVRNKGTWCPKCKRDKSNIT